MRLNMTKAIDKTRFKFIADALHATGGFFDGNHLVKYPREGEEKFKARKEIAWYPNPLLRAVSRFVGHLSMKPVVRVVEAPLAKLFAEDADWQGNALDVWLHAFMIEARARGCCLALVDMPASVPDTQAAQIEHRAVPFVRAIYPEQVSAFTVSDRGLITSISYDSDWTDGSGKTHAAVRTWTAKEWSVKVNGETVAGASHPLGACPVIVFTESGTFPSEGAFSPIADMAKRLYNMLSERDELLRSQTFSILGYQLPKDSSFDTGDAAAVAETVGTHNMLMYKGDQPPVFISPDSAPTEAYAAAIKEIKEHIDDVGLNIDLSGQAESGIAIQLRYESLNASLSSFSGRMGDFERQLWDLVHRWLGQENRVTTAWPTEFAIADVAGDLEIIQNLQAVNAPQSAINAGLKRAIGQWLTNADPADIQRILSDINAMTHERKTSTTKE